MLADAEVLQILGIENFKPVAVEKKEINGRTIYSTSSNEISINRDDQWLHIMDNSLYYLYHSKEVKTVITVLSKKHDIVCCSVGDADHSFSFHYYKGGELRRKLVAIDPTYQKAEIKENVGTPITLEEKCLANEDEFIKVLSLAESVGINFNNTSQMTFYLPLS